MKNRLLSIGIITTLIFFLSIKVFSQAYTQGLRVNVSDVTNTYQNDMIVFFVADATDGKDTKYEITPPFSTDVNYPNLAAYLSTGQKVIPDALPTLTGDKKVDLWVELGFNDPTTSTKNLTLSITDVAGFLPSTVIYLFDATLGKVQNLKTDPIYPNTAPNYFTMSTPMTTAAKTRFSLCFDYLGVGTPISSFTVNPSPVVANNNATITFTGTAPASASYIWDLGNAQLVSGNINSAGPLQVKWDDAHTGTQTIKLKVNGLCFSSTQTSVNVTVNPGVQAVITPSGTVPLCLGQTLTLNANTGVDFSYQWKVDGGNIDGATNASYVAENSGSYTVEITAPSGTSESEPTVVIVNQLPTEYLVTGGGAYCSGTNGVAINLAGSQQDVNYQLKYNNINTGSPVPGTGSPITFGNQTLAGAYTVVATDANTGCSSTMTGSKNISLAAAPNAFNVTGGGSLCAGDAGKAVGLANSESGVNYQLQLNSVNVGAPVPGTGSSLDFGLQSTAGTYTVVATNNSTSCTKEMTGNAVITVNSSPVAYDITGGGEYCEGGTGLPVTLTNSEIGVNYQLKVDGVNSGSAVAGTGASIIINNLTSAGTYTMVGINAGNCSTQMNGSLSISINPKPSVSISPVGPIILNTGNALSLTSNVGGATINTYAWYKDGVLINDATDNNYNVSQVTVPDAGTYKLNITDNKGCTNTSNEVVVTVLPPSEDLAAFPSAEPNVICIGESVVLKANATGGTGNYSYVWTPGGSTEATFSDTPQVNTVYSVQVSDGNDVVVELVSVTVNPIPDATISYDGLLNVCEGTAKQFTANSGEGYTYQWTLNGNIIDGATNQTLNALLSGDYRVVVTSIGCSKTSDPTTLNVYAKPTVEIFPAGPVTITEGSMFQLTSSATDLMLRQWQKDAADITDSTGLSLYVNAAGSYTLNILDENGCNATSNAVQVLICTPPALIVNINADLTAVCAGGSAKLSLDVTGGAVECPGSYTYSYLWSTEDNTSEITVTPEFTTTYTVTVYDGITSVEKSIVITVNPLPEATIIPMGDATFCEGGSVVLQANTGEGLNYQWLRNGNEITDANDNTYTASLEGNYTVKVIDNGCTSESAASIVVVNALPSAVISPSGAFIIQQGDTKTLTANDGTGYTYQWMKDGVNIDNATNMTYDAAETGIYTVKVTSELLCSNISEGVNITVELAPSCDLNIPTGLHTTDVKSNYVALAWNRVNAEQDSAFVVRIYEPGKANFRYRVTGNTFTNMGQLLANTEYYAQVRTRCTSNPDKVLHKSDYSEIVPFTTKVEECPPAYNLNSDNITNTTASVSWSAGPSANRYTVRYKGNQPGMAYHFRQSNTNSMQLQWLKPGTTYTWDVKVFCDAISTKRFYVAQGQFTTTGTYGGKMVSTTPAVESIDMYVFPNPSNGIFTVAVSGLDKAARLTVQNLQGQNVFTKECEKSFTEDVDLSGLARGVYFIKLMNDNTNQVRKIVIQ